LREAYIGRQVFENFPQRFAQRLHGQLQAGSKDQRSLAEASGEGSPQFFEEKVRKKSGLKQNFSNY